MEKHFDEIDEEIFQGFDRPSELILCIPGNEKSDLDKVA
jgi:hypothetical protein